MVVEMQGLYQQGRLSTEWAETKENLCFIHACFCLDENCYFIQILRFQVLFSRLCFSPEIDVYKIIKSIIDK